MKLNVEINENLISLTNNGGNVFNINTDNLSSLNVLDLVNFIQSEVKDYESKCEYKLIVMYDSSPESPREWDNVGTMIGFHRNYTAGDKHNYSSPLELMYDLADRYDSNEAEKLEDLYNEDEITESEYFRKLKELANKNNVILPVYLLEHGDIKYSTEDFNDSWDSGQIGIVYTPHDKVKAEWGEVNDESINNAIRCMKSEVETYSQWANGEVYGYRLVKVDEYGDEIEELDSCWGFYGSNLEENGIKDELPEELRHLVNEAEYKYSC